MQIWTPNELLHLDFWSSIVVVVHLRSWVWLFATPWTATPRLPCPSLLPRICSNSHLLSWWCNPTISSSVTLFSSCPQSFPASGSFLMSRLFTLWPPCWNFSFSISPSNAYSGLISFRIDWFDLLAIQKTLKSLLQHHNSKASILQCSVFFMVQLSHLYMTTGKIIALTIWTFVSKVMVSAFLISYTHTHTHTRLSLKKKKQNHFVMLTDSAG